MNETPKIKRLEVEVDIQCCQVCHQPFYEFTENVLTHCPHCHHAFTDMQPTFIRKASGYFVDLNLITGDVDIIEPPLLEQQEDCNEGRVADGTCEPNTL